MQNSPVGGYGKDRLADGVAYGKGQQAYTHLPSKVRL